ncbi:SH3 beta-barrel fold-containing protein [uncultured Bacteroides sp.]|uniref:SH3 beta-barrel fold-containing protein n=1 Tax=uncultured Bacteroides sp. TaxID=162156 RepID=UPI002AAC4424|nr:SH3 beta-barrel fold-containing protein [uncultured Bacteroides sp.]
MKESEKADNRLLEARVSTLRRERIMTVKEAISLAHRIDALIQRMLHGEAEFSYMRQTKQIKHTRGTLTNYEKTFRRALKLNPENSFMLYYDLNEQRWYTFHVAFLL